MDNLKNKGLKTTKTRTLILELLKNESPLSADQIYEKLKHENIKVSSIYRNLATFTKENLLIKSISMDGISYYQLNTHTHKHQIICTNCGKSVAIDNCPINNIKSKVEKNTGFLITQHNFEISGICKDCQNEDENNK